MAELKKYTQEELIQINPDASVKLCLDLGCGERKKQGFIGIDTLSAKGVDIVCDISKGLPCEDNIVDYIYSSFFFEHLPDVISLFKELYRVSKPNAIIEFKVPHYQSFTQYKDPTHQSILLPEMMRYFSDDKWYGSNYNINTNFKIIHIDYNYLPPFNYLSSKWIFFLWPITYPIVLFSRRFLWNVVHSITIKLKVIK